MMNRSTAPAARSTWRYLSAYSGKSAPVQWAFPLREHFDRTSSTADFTRRQFDSPAKV
jgi:hypothetical protein